MNEPERWFVIAHEVTNSGASRMLLQILAGVKQRRGDAWSCEILMRRGGELEAEFARLGRVHFLPHRWAEGRSFRAGVLRKFLDRPWLQPRRLARWLPELKAGGFDLVYNNSATNGYLVPAARSLGCPVVTHVHELAASMRRFNSPAALDQTMTNTDHFIAVSAAVGTDIAACGVPSDRIQVVHNFLPELPGEATEAGRRRRRAELGLPADGHIVTGCGHIDPIKGVDLFVEMAAGLVAHVSEPEKLYFIWLGGITDARYTRWVKEQARQSGLEGLIRFVGHVPQTDAWMEASDVVTVTSRQESFSLVALEAAARGCPVVAFKGARGVGSVLGEHSRLLVAEHDVAAMVALVAGLLADPALRQREGRALRGRIGANYLAPHGIKSVLAVTDEVRASHRK